MARRRGAKYTKSRIARLRVVEDFLSAPDAMRPNEMADSGIPSARIAKIRVTGETLLAIDWAEGLRAGKSDEVDLSPAINSYKFYRPLRDNAALFATAHLIDDGYAVVWGGGEIDMSADMNEKLAGGRALRVSDRDLEEIRRRRADPNRKLVSHEEARARIKRLGA